MLSSILQFFHSCPAIFIIGEKSDKLNKILVKFKGENKLMLPTQPTGLWIYVIN